VTEYSTNMCSNFYVSYVATLYFTVKRETSAVSVSA